MTQTRPDAVAVEETRRGKFQAQVRAGDAAFLADEPVSAGGLGSGPNPYDLLCSALGACTVMTVRMYADLKGLPLDRARVLVRHSRGDDGRDRFERELVLEGDLTEAQRIRLLQIAERCPVHRTLERGSDIVTTLDAFPPPPLDPVSTGQHVSDMTDACA